MRKKSFIAIYAKKFKPWKYVRSISEEARDTEISAIMVLSRWDGFFGFPGGYIEEGEEPIEGAIRECEEEINFSPEKENLELIEKKNNLYLYTYETTIEEMISIQKEMNQGIDYGEEITGSVILYLGDYKNKKPLKNFLSLPYISNSKEQIKKIIKEKELLSINIEKY
jgi:8-oxo-dGTP pyrophosphatase MutT (NUDIX family)